MNNGYGHSAANAHDPLQRIAAQMKAQEQLEAVLQATLQNPHTIKRANLNLAALVPTGGGQHELIVALPSGERWDIPLSAPALAAIHRASAEAEVEQDGDEATS